MSAKDLLFEIGTEEIPARFMPKALADICQYAGEEFASAHIEHSRIKAECTPRRIVLAVEKLSAAQSDSVEVFKGPLKAQAFDDNGNPTKAAEVCRSKRV